MHIALNGQRLSVERPAGPEKYTKNIYEALAKIDRDNIYTIYVDNEPDKIDLQISSSNFQIKYLKKKYSWTQYSLAGELFKSKPDIFFTPVHTMPLARSHRTKYVSMIHGLEFNYNDYNTIAGKLLRGKHEWYVAKFSDALIVPSHSTKQEILDMNWGVQPNKMTVVEEGVGDRFYKRSPEEIESIRKKHFLPEQYLLFISTIQPRKNLPKLIEAFSLVAKDLPNNEVKLAIAGKLGWSYEESLNAPHKFGIENRVKFLGRVSDEDLPVLISGATAYVNPSLEEGFGLPLLESMASSTPCLVSSIGAHKELGENTVMYFDPNDINDMKEKMIKILSEGYPENLIEKAYERSKMYTWEKSAEKTLEVFKKILG